MMKKRILIIEDDTVYGQMLLNWLTKNNYEVTLTALVESAKKEISNLSFDLILSDIRLPDGDGIALLTWIRKQNIHTPILMMTGYSEIQSAVSAIKLGAEDYLEKPINPSLLKEKIEKSILSKNSTHPRPAQPPKITPKIVMGTSNSAIKMYDYVRKVAPTKMSVLIIGESGTGKEHVAKMIHDYSERNKHPFIAIDCGSLSKDLAPSELFGHLKGAFTSALQDKKGVFEQAIGGTVFLDEIGNLSYEVQVQLLRALQEQKVRPVGATHDVSIDVRIIAATNEDLNKAIEDGRFREDLFHRLNEFFIHIPALRERTEDIPIFADHFKEQACQEFDKQNMTFAPKTLEMIQNHEWSGNLRELRNTIRRAVLFANGNTIDQIELTDTSITKNEEQTPWKGDEKKQIETALERARGNKSLAAKLLKIDRKTLYNKMHQYEIDL